MYLIRASKTRQQRNEQSASDKLALPTPRTWPPCYDDVAKDYARKQREAREQGRYLP